MMKLSAAMDSWERVAISSGTKQIGVTYMDVECRLEFIALLNAATELLALAKRAGDNPCTCHLEMTQHKPCMSCAARRVIPKVKGPTT